MGRTGSQAGSERTRGLRGWVTRRRKAAWGMAIFGVAFTVFVLVWFQPHKAFLDQRVDEDAPAAVAQEMPDSSSETTAPEVKEPVVLSQGAFRSLDHDTTGRAVVLELADGSHVLRFEDLETLNGPDLHVYLSEVPAGPDVHAYGERFIDLGKLKGNVGSQNYRIPAGTDLSRFRSAVIWCKRFAVGFGVAPLA